MANKFTRAQRAAAAESTLVSLRRAKRKAQMTKTILLITFIYIFTSLPGILQTGYFYTTIIVLESGQMIVSLINAIQFSYPAFNFFILYFTNRLFANEVKRLLSRFKRNKVASLSMNLNARSPAPPPFLIVTNRKPQSRTNETLRY